MKGIIHLANTGEQFEYELSDEEIANMPPLVELVEPEPEATLYAQIKAQASELAELRELVQGLLKGQGAEK